MKRFIVLCLATLLLLSVLVGCDSGDAIDTSELEHLSRYEMPEASFWRDADGKYYIYIKYILLYPQYYHIKQLHLILYLQKRKTSPKSTPLYF